ncbi:hypothetical protein MMC21_007583 [Puttea exsequens]|nr:hypothetical protein [Puttea exsequens]
MNPTAPGTMNQMRLDFICNPATNTAQGNLHADTSRPQQSSQQAPANTTNNSYPHGYDVNPAREHSRKVTSDALHPQQPANITKKRTATRHDRTATQALTRSATSESLYANSRRPQQIPRLNSAENAKDSSAHGHGRTSTPEPAQSKALAKPKLSITTVNSPAHGHDRASTQSSTQITNSNNPHQQAPVNTILASSPLHGNAPPQAHLQSSIPSAAPSLHIHTTNFATDTLDDATRYKCLCGYYNTFADWIECSAGPLCEIQWYHLMCVGLDNAPRGDWFCPICKSNRKRKAATLSAATMEEWYAALSGSESESSSESSSESDVEDRLCGILTCGRRKPQPRISSATVLKK